MYLSYILEKKNIVGVYRGLFILKPTRAIPPQRTRHLLRCALFRTHFHLSSW